MITCLLYLTAVLAIELLYLRTQPRIAAAAITFTILIAIWALIIIYTINHIGDTQ